MYMHACICKMYVIIIIIIVSVIDLRQRERWREEWCLIKAMINSKTTNLQNIHTLVF